MFYSLIIKQQWNGARRMYSYVADAAPYFLPFAHFMVPAGV